MCMTLAMTLGMSIGVRKTLPMMYGELLGVATVSIASAIGVSAIMLKFPTVFELVKYIGACYLLYVGINMFLSKGKLALSNENSDNKSICGKQLFNQGFVTAIANPKGWAFMISLLPPFINEQLAFAPQLTILVVIILLSEFICMMTYAAGGRTIGKLLVEQENVKLLNKISGYLMMGVALWLALS